MLLISPSHHWGQLFSTQFRWVGEASVRAHVSLMLRMTDTERKQEKIQHFKGRHIPKVLAVSSRCGWRLSEATCLLLPATHTRSDCVSVRWCWNEKGVCLQFTTLSISCSTGLAETCPKHPSIQLINKCNHGNYCLKMTKTIWKTVFSMISGDCVGLFYTYAALK